MAAPPSSPLPSSPAKQLETAETLREKFLKMGRPHISLGKDDTRPGGPMWQLCELVQEALGARFVALIEQADDRPLLFSYSSDSTPALTQMRYTARPDSVKAITKEFGQATGYLLQTAWLRSTDSVGRQIQTFYTKSSVPLSACSGAAEEFSAMNEFVASPRIYGHKGVLITHVCFDRKLWQSLTRLSRQKSELWYDIMSGSGPKSVELVKMQLSEIHLATPCANHDTQNALKWSLQPAADMGTAVHKNLFVAVASVRNSYDLIAAKLPVFVMGRLTPVADIQVDSESWFLFWTRCGVSDQLALKLCDVSLHYSEGKLKFFAKHSGKPGFAEDMVETILAVFTFTQFTDSRWVTVGRSCRTFLAAHALGLRDLIGLIRADKAMSDYHMHGFACADNHVLRYAAVAAMSSYVSDEVLCALLKDDRLAVRAPACSNILREEMDRLCAIPAEVWQVAGRAAGESGNVLKAMSIKAGFVQAFFFHHRALKTASACPWRLASGNIEQNLEELLTVHWGEPLT